MMKIYNLFWREDYSTSWGFLGSYDSEEKANEGMQENLKFREIPDDEIEEYEEDYFIEVVMLNQYVLNEYFG